MVGIRTVGIGCIVAGIFFSGCRQSPDKAYSVILNDHGKTIAACAKADDKEFAATVDALRGLLAKHSAWPKAAEIQLMIGSMQAERGRFDTAREDLEKVVLYYTQKQALAARAMFLIGVTYEKQNRINEAAKEYAELMKRYPSTHEGLEVPVRIAALYKRCGQGEESARAYRNAALHYIRLLEYNPNSAKVAAIQQRLLAVYADSGEWNEAIAVLQRLAGKYPKTNCGALALYNTAMLYQVRYNEPDKAIQLLRDIVTAYAGSGIARQASLDLIRVTAHKGDMAAAQKTLRELVRRYPKETALCAAAHFALAGGYENAGQWEQALAVHRQIQSAYAATLECLRSYISVGFHDLKLNQTSKAGESFGAAVSRGKWLIDQSRDKAAVIEAYKLLSTAYSMQHKWREGVAILEEFVNKYPDSPETAGALYQAGSIYYAELKNIPKARACFAQLLESGNEDRYVLAAQSMMEKMRGPKGGS